MKLALIGAGQRGMIYAEDAYYKKNVEIIAVVEPHEGRRAIAAEKFCIAEEYCFSCVADFFTKGKICDAVILATMDKDHFDHAMSALDCGYDILLEKPISPDPKECIEIEEKANALGRSITVCHVLRYTNFFSTIKEILDSGDLGRIIAIKHSENIGNFHMAHSFVRGNWRNDQLTSPIIMQKSCHDLDILLWLTGSHCKKVAAFGSLTYFKETNAPAGSAHRCLECPVAESCRFDARKAYLPTLGSWPTEVVTLEQTEEALLEALKTSPYGRCVYRCDNNVCDHMSIIMEFENDITATFSLTAQTSACHRNIHIMCEHGEIVADDGARQITVTKHVASQADTFDQKTIHIRTGASGHGGGDAGIMEDFTTSLSASSPETKSSISHSVESHLMACAIEQSRLSGKVVDLADFRNTLK